MRNKRENLQNGFGHLYIHIHIHEWKKRDGTREDAAVAARHTLSMAWHGIDES